MGFSGLGFRIARECLEIKKKDSQGPGGSIGLKILDSNKVPKLRVPLEGAHRDYIGLCRVGICKVYAFQKKIGFLLGGPHNEDVVFWGGMTFSTLNIQLVVLQYVKVMQVL